jgi:hypothetical protein
VVRLVVDRRQEDDRDVLGTVAPLDVRGGLEPVHAGHLHIEEDHGELVAEQRLEGLLATARPHQVLVERAQDGFEREEVLRPVVDEQDLRLLHHAPSRWVVADAESSAAR